MLLGSYLVSVSDKKWISGILGQMEEPGNLFGIKPRLIQCPMDQSCLSCISGPPEPLA